MHGPRTQDEQVVLVRQNVRDGVEELREVLEAMRLTRRPGRAAAVATARVVPDVSRRPMMRRDVRLDPIHHRCPFDPANDDGFAGIDPDEGELVRARTVRRPSLHGLNPHERAQAGRSSASTARSA